MTSEPRRPWYQPQFRLRTLLLATAWIALFIATNVVPVHVSNVHANYQFTRGFPFSYLDLRGMDVGDSKTIIFISLETPLVITEAGFIGRDSQSGFTGVPLVSHWPRLFANIAVFAAVGVGLWLLVPWAIKRLRKDAPALP